MEHLQEAAFQHSAPVAKLDLDQIARSRAGHENHSPVQARHAGAAVRQGLDLKPSAPLERRLSGRARRTR